MLLTLGNATVEVQVVGRADFGRRKCVACGCAVVGVMLCDKCDEQPRFEREIDRNCPEMMAHTLRKIGGRVYLYGRKDGE